MRKHILAGIATTLMFAEPAMSADMAVKTPVYKATPAAVFSWTGAYLGVHGGCGWSPSPTPTNYAVDPNDNQLDSFTSATGNGCFGGGQVGYNYQLSNNIVVGIEIDGAFSNIKSSFIWNQPPDGSGDVNNWESKLTSFGTFRGRLGYGAGQWLPYITGGLAWGRNRITSTCPSSCDNLVNSNSPDVDPSTTSDARTHYGWVFGVGLEYAMNSNWSIKGEYLHLDLASQRYNVQVDYDFGVPPGFDSGRLKIDTVKVGLNYRFGLAGPVVAKY